MILHTVMQSTADTLAQLIDRLCPDQRPQHIAATGGGAKSAFWLEMCSRTINAEVFAAADGLQRGCDDNCFNETPLPA